MKGDEFVRIALLRLLPLLLVSFIFPLTFLLSSFDLFVVAFFLIFVSPFSLEIDSVSDCERQNLLVCSYSFDLETDEAKTINSKLSFQGFEVQKI